MKSDKNFRAVSPKYPTSSFGTNATAMLYKWVGICILLFWGWGCANQVSPTGGKKDEQPPQVRFSSPLRNTTNFNKTSFQLRFDEFVSLNDESQQILISPYMKTPPEFKLRGKTLTVHFKEPLLPNTTYTVNFGQSIKDITEKNTMTGLEYTFSTGNFLDSLRVKGALIDAATYQPVANVLVMLYPVQSDTLFLTTPPRYLVRTDDKGIFSLNHIAANTYQLLALDDKNGNYYYDQPNENIAFLPNPIEVNLANRDTTYRLSLFNEGNETVKLMERFNRNYGQVELFFSKPQDTLDIQVIPPLPKDSSFVFIAPTKDTVNIWYHKPDLKELQIIAAGSGGYLDTIQFPRLLDSTKIVPFRFMTNMKGGRRESFVLPNTPLSIQASAPIKTWFMDSIKLLEDSTALNLAAILEKDDMDKRRFKLNYKWQPYHKYTFSIPDSALVDIWGRYNKSYKTTFSTADPAKFGTLILTFKHKSPDKAYLIRLYDKAFKKMLIEQKLAPGQKELTLNYIDAQEYSILVVVDANQNGKWDTGNYAQKLMPELVWAYPKAILVKANWDTDADINLP